MMRGSDEQTASMFGYVSCEARVPPDNPLRLIRAVVDEALDVLSSEFDGLYARHGRPSIAPEKLLRASLLQAFYSIRSERQLMEQFDYNLLFRWFVGLARDAPIWDASTFSKNRERLLARTEAQQRDARQHDRPGRAAGPQVGWAVEHPGRCRACADGEPQRPRGPGVPDPCERHGRARCSTRAGGPPGNPAPDHAWGGQGLRRHGFITGLRERQVTPHIATDRRVSKLGVVRRSGIDRRTERHPGHAVSQRIRKRIEEVFGWIKGAAGLRQTKYRGRVRVGWSFTLATTAYNLIRLPNLFARAAA